MKEKQARELIESFDRYGPTPTEKLGFFHFRPLPTDVTFLERLKLIKEQRPNDFRLCIQAEDAKGHTLLHYACVLDDAEAVDFLIKEGAKLKPDQLLRANIESYFPDPIRILLLRYFLKQKNFSDLEIAVITRDIPRMNALMKDRKIDLGIIGKLGKPLITLLDANEIIKGFENSPSFTQDEKDTLDHLWPDIKALSESTEERFLPFIYLCIVACPEQALYATKIDNIFYHHYVERAQVLPTFTAQQKEGETYSGMIFFMDTDNKLYSLSMQLSSRLLMEYNVFITFINQIFKLVYEHGPKAHTELLPAVRKVLENLHTAEEKIALFKLISGWRRTFGFKDQSFLSQIKSRFFNMETFVEEFDKFMQEMAHSIINDIHEERVLPSPIDSNYFFDTLLKDHPGFRSLICADVIAKKYVKDLASKTGLSQRKPLTPEAELQPLKSKESSDGLTGPSKPGSTGRLTR